MTRQFCFRAGGRRGGGERVPLYSGTNNELCPNKTAFPVPFRERKGVLKFSYEHPVIFTCILVSLRIQFDWAKNI